MFLKKDNRINKDCQLTVTNITGPQAIYLDQGLWAVSVDKPTQMECKAQPHHALLGYPFHNMAAHTEAMPTREGI